MAWDYCLTCPDLGAMFERDLGFVFQLFLDLIEEKFPKFMSYIRKQWKRLWNQKKSDQKRIQ